MRREADKKWQKSHQAGVVDVKIDEVLVAKVEEDGPARFEVLVVHEVALREGVLGREPRGAPVEVVWRGGSCVSAGHRPGVATGGC